MEEKENYQDSQLQISKEQKVGLFLLFVFAILAVGLGFIQMRNTMYGPFALKNVAPYISADEVNTIEAQRLRDTDHDGLNDFEELYVYGTSMYLADSDSDGLSDKEEVEKGTNPLCPEGSQCIGIADESSDAERGASSSFNLLGIDSNPDFGETPIDLSAALKDPVQVKKMLISAGLSADLLKNISDEELMAAVNEIMVVSTTDNSEAINVINSLGNLNYNTILDSNSVSNTTNTISTTKK